MKEKLSNFRQNHPIVLSIILFIVYTVLFQVISSILVLSLQAMNIQISNFYLIQLIGEIIGIAISFGIVFLFKYKDIFKSKKGIGKGLLAGGWFIFAALCALFSNISVNIDAPLQSVGNIIIFSLCMFSIGFAEELFFRGIISKCIFEKHGKSPKGVYISLIVSSVIFGCFHLPNLLTGASLLGVLIQVIVASFMGMAFCAIYYRTKNIWAVAILHGLVDFCALIASGIFVTESTVVTEISAYSYMQLVGIIPYIIVVVILLRPKKMKEILSYNEISEVK